MYTIRVINGERSFILQRRIPHIVEARQLGLDAFRRADVLLDDIVEIVSADSGVTVQRFDCDGYEAWPVMS